MNWTGIIEKEYKYLILQQLCNDMSLMKVDRIDDEMFVNLVQRLIPYQNVTAFTDSSTRRLSQVRERGCETVAQNIDNEIPKEIIFQSISSHFKGSYTTDRYLKLIKRNSKFESRTPNIDGPMKAPLQPHQSLQSYRKYFCRRCFIYNCLSHPWTDNVADNTYYREKNLKEEHNLFTESCSTTCYLVGKIGNPESAQDDIETPKQNENSEPNSTGSIVANISRHRQTDKLNETFNDTFIDFLMGTSNNSYEAILERGLAEASKSSETTSADGMSLTDLFGNLKSTPTESMVENVSRHRDNGELNGTFNDASESTSDEMSSTKISEKVVNYSYGAETENQRSFSDKTLFLASLKVFPNH